MNNLNITMKYLIVVSILVYYTVFAQDALEEFEKQSKKYNKECVNETKIDAAVVKNATHYGHYDNEKLKDYFLCYYKKMGFITASGEYDASKVKEKVAPLIDDEELMTTIEGCAKESSGDGKSNAMKMAKCYYKLKTSH